MALLYVQNTIINGFEGISIYWPYFQNTSAKILLSLAVS